MNLRLTKNRDGLEEIDLTDKVKVRLTAFDKELVRLNKEDFLPRYNTLTVNIENNSDETVDSLLLTVLRTNSKIGDDNHHIVLIRTYDLKPRDKGQYSVKVFDWFNEKFDSIEIRLSTTDDWDKRKRIDNWDKRDKVDAWINEGEKITKKVDNGLLKLFR